MKIFANGRMRNARPPVSFLCVHPNVELYGSDRVFLQSVSAIKAKYPDASVTVVLTGPGELEAAMRGLGIKIHISKIFVLRRSELGSNVFKQTLNVLRRSFELLERTRSAMSLIASHDILYISTVVPIDYILATRFQKTRAFVHVHELPTGLARYVFSAILRGSDATLIFISLATRRSYLWLKNKKSSVIWNGTVARPVQPPSSAAGNLHILMIGRFNAWKGQLLLLDAIANLRSCDRERLRIRVLGSAYEGQEHFRTAIQTSIQAHDLTDIVDLIDFDPDPDPSYAWADVVVVPSTKPEPFGLVAIEAMASGRAVIGARHGGLAEIVLDEVTGFLIPPRDCEALTSAIRTYLEKPYLVQTHGAAGAARFSSHFAEPVYTRKFLNMIRTF